MIQQLSHRVIRIRGHSHRRLGENRICSTPCDIRLPRGAERTAQEEIPVPANRIIELWVKHPNPFDQHEVDGVNLPAQYGKRELQCIRVALRVTRVPQLRIKTVDEVSGEVPRLLFREFDARGPKSVVHALETQISEFKSIGDREVKWNLYDLLKEVTTRLGISARVPFTERCCHDLLVECHNIRCVWKIRSQLHQLEDRLYLGPIQAIDIIDENDNTDALLREPPFYSDPEFFHVGRRHSRASRAQCLADIELYGAGQPHRDTRRKGAVISQPLGYRIPGR